MTDSGAPVQSLQRPLIALVGPTASGKTSVAQALAERMGGSVLSADSMQIYQYMDIGTGKIPQAERTVPYYGLDIAQPNEPYSVAMFQQYARSVISRLDAEQAQVILCGGTGFYIRAVIDAYDFPAGEQVGNPVRDLYNARVEELGSHAVWDELNAVDPASAALLHPNDAKRIVRAFELLNEGTSYAQQHRQLQVLPQYYPAIQFGLQVTPHVLRERIDARVDQMVADGLVDEVESLLSQGLRDALTAQQAIGYKEIVEYLDGTCSLEEAIEQIKLATHRYAKRQRTWFNHDKRIIWLPADDIDVERLTKAIVDEIHARRDA